MTLLINSCDFVDNKTKACYQANKGIIHKRWRKVANSQKNLEIKKLENHNDLYLKCDMIENLRNKAINSLELIVLCHMK